MANSIEFRAQKQVCVKPHICGRVQIYFFCCIEGSQKHVAFIIHNGRHLEQLELFLELASWPNWAIDGEGPWLEWWPRSWCWAPWSYMQTGDTHCNTPPIWALWRCGQTQSSPQWRHMKTHLEFAKKNT